MQISAMRPGFEANVYRVEFAGSVYVLKIWDRRAKPDVLFQFKLLRKLRQLGIPVSRPFGYGKDKENNEAMLISFDGHPVGEATESKLDKIARILMDIHALPPEALADAHVPKHDYVSFFHSGIENIPDLHALLLRLIGLADMRNDRLIHGDYNFGNVLERDGIFTVIDWTDGQWGDPRFDIAWSLFVASIYEKEEHVDHYRSIFLTKGGYTEEELEIFEALACIRWLALSRLADVMGMAEVPKVRAILRRNRFLDESLLQ